MHPNMRLSMMRFLIISFNDPAFGVMCWYLTICSLVASNLKKELVEKFRTWTVDAIAPKKRNPPMG